MDKMIQNTGLGFFLFIYSAISNSATLIVDNGSLMGASEVDVNGVLYDVSFVDGTCIELFNGCNENTDFPFTNPANLNDGVLLQTAMEALLNQVFIDSPLGNFNSDPALTNGCERDCFIGTPLWVSSVGGLGMGVVYNSQNSNVDSAGSGGGGFNYDDLSLNIRSTYAVWSQPAVVPVPSAVWLFGSGLLGLIGLSRRNKTA